jgi:outer membrane protein TolC
MVGRIAARLIGCFASAVALTLMAGSVRAEPPPADGPPPLPTPQVTDPMLAAPPPPARTIASWAEALAMVRAQAPDYLTSEESVVRAEAQKRVALAAVLPTLTGSAAYTHQFESITVAIPGVPSFRTPAPNVWSLGAAAAWNLVNPRGLYALGTADRQIEVARLSFEDRRRQIAISIVDAMLATLVAERVADLNRVGLRSALERLVLTQTRLQFGQGTALDVDRASQDVAAARGLLISGDESLRQSREALGAALGSPVPVAAPGDLDLAQFEASVARTCRLNADIERRPDVAAARARVELAERTVVDAELLFVPSLGVSSQLSTSTVAILGPQTTWSLQGLVTVPFYDGGARYGLMRDARAAAAQAHEALVSARLNAIVTSAQAERAVGVEQASRDVANEQRDLAQRIDARTREGYARGLGTSLDLVTSAQTLRQNEINLAFLDFQLGAARANAVLTNAECLY